MKAIERKKNTRKQHILFRPLCFCFLCVHVFENVFYIRDLMG